MSQNERRFLDIVLALTAQNNKTILRNKQQKRPKQELPKKKKKTEKDKTIEDVVKTPKKKKQLQFKNSYQASGESTYAVKGVDYAELFNYLGKYKTTDNTSILSGASSAIDTYSEGFGEREIMGVDELESYLRKFTIRNFVGGSEEGISAEQKERFNYFALFNKTRIMLILYNTFGFAGDPMETFAVQQAQDMQNPQ